MTKRAKPTPIRRALRTGSSLVPSVRDGLGALAPPHRACLDPASRSGFADSLDIDEGLRESHGQEHRWDYILGHSASEALVGVELHAAEQGEVSTVIKKRSAALDQLRPHLREGVKVAKWLWVASGKVHFANTEKVRLRLDQNGIEFVGPQVGLKHVPARRSAAAEHRPGAGKRKQ